MERAGRLSNPSQEAKTAGQQGYVVTVVNPHHLPNEGSDAWSRYWLEARGRLSNPRSDLNQAVDQLLEGMEAIVARQQGRITSRRGVLKQLSPRDVDALVRSYQAGASVRQLVEEFEIHRTTVMGHLEKRGVPRRANTRKMTDEQAKEARAMRDVGVSYAEIARKFRVHPKTVTREIGKNRGSG